MLSAGDRLGPYEVVSPLGAGGMGEVYRARHAKLDREVALKVLPHELATDSARLRRFEQEARAASALNHPSIVTIYDIADHEGTLYIAMELVQGATFRALLGEGPMPVTRTLSLARQVAEGLARAHAVGIVHRDLKPENLMVTQDGLAKILDFGLAKRLTPEVATAESDLTTASGATRPGIVLGTVPYMSPEQAAGRSVDHRSDQFSFGVVLYEMLAGQRPFRGDSAAMVVSAILRDVPPALRSVRPEAPVRLAKVVERCLEKDPAQRFASAQDLALELSRCAEAGAPHRLSWFLRRPTGVAMLGLLLAALVALGLQWRRFSRERWARAEALPEITRLTEAGDLFAAYRMALAAQKVIPDEPRLREMQNRITIPVQVVTEPAGAEVEIKGYDTPDAPWESLGRTPLQGIRIPYALMRWRIRKEGFESFEGAPMGLAPFTALAMGFPLDPVGKRPPGMVRIPGGPFVRRDLPSVALEPYWLDRLEVTNGEYKAFVDQGGYGRKEYWTEPFRDGDLEVPWEQATASLRDTTGRPGPSTWELGSFPEGKQNYPVGGVSFYEAAAYCAFAGKQLPSVYHWLNAAAQDQFSDILRFSNFGTEGPAPVGSHKGLGDYGTYDMAGNVKEWCWNATGAKRFLLGGSWGEPTYLFKDLDARRPLDRSANAGFRCARYDPSKAAALLGPVERTLEIDAQKPVDERVFEAYRRLYAYDRTPLQAKVESRDDSSPYWRKETVSFAAAYGSERMAALLFLPKNAAPPYEAVLWFPGDDAFFIPSSETLASAYLFDFLPRSGRALVHPIYKGMYERHVPFSRAPNEWRDMMTMWSKDLGRTVDYLESRNDFDAKRLGYYGFSAGALYGPVFTAIDPRFGASVLIGAGTNPERVPPEMSTLNFAPRSHVPTLMIGGRDDFILPIDTVQKPLFRLLGARESDKRHLILEGGHLPPDRRAIMKETLDWFDRYLGPVKAAPASTGGSF